jgi:hypothetical protein
VRQKFVKKNNKKQKKKKKQKQPITKKVYRGGMGNLSLRNRSLNSMKMCRGLSINGNTIVGY